MIVRMNEKSPQAIFAERLMESAKNREQFGTRTITLYHEGEALKAYGESASDLAQATGLQLNTKCGLDYLEFYYGMRDMIYPRIVKHGYKACIITK